MLLAQLKPKSLGSRQRMLRGCLFMVTATRSLKSFSMASLTMLVVSPLAGAQVNDSLAVADSANATTPPAHHPLMLPAFAALAGVIAFAPPIGFFLLEPNPGNTARELPDHVSIRIEGGGSSPASSNRVDWASAVRLEALRGRLYSDVELNRLDAIEDSWHYTARIGHLWRPHPAFATGVVLGYRDAFLNEGVPSAEFGLPLIMNFDDGVVRLEPSYFLRRQYFAWNYRFEGEFTVRPNLRLGFGITLRDIPRDRGAGALSFILGWFHSFSSPFVDPGPAP